MRVFLHTKSTWLTTSHFCKSLLRLFEPIARFFVTARIGRKRNPGHIHYTDALLKYPKKFEHCCVLFLN